MLLYITKPRLNRYKYCFMEEMLENIDGARQVFQRWMQWDPPTHAFSMFFFLFCRKFKVFFFFFLIF
jgi:hypothetical protein